jgi:hypothetical protein
MAATMAVTQPPGNAAADPFGRKTAGAPSGVSERRIELSCDRAMPRR